jgi:hypothetical protein
MRKISKKEVQPELSPGTVECIVAFIHFYSVYGKSAHVQIILLIMGGAMHFSFLSKKRMPCIWTTSIHYLYLYYKKYPPFFLLLVVFFLTKWTKRPLHNKKKIQPGVNEVSVHPSLKRICPGTETKNRRTTASQ